MAYLIHHLGWPLSQAYSHVVARRRTVSPNLGFVAELMAFEKRRQEIAHTSIVHSSAERGAKSAKDTVDETTADQVIGASDSGRQRRVRDPRARDSLPYLPPTLSAEQVTRVDELPSQSETSNDQEVAPVEEHLAPSTRPSKASFGLEHRGEDGRYRSRRPPADAHILAPSRRATIAALGSDHQEKLNELLGDARRLHR
ncbi:DUSP, MKP [Ceraceosorus bombacis]|uniref:DUSP, MKP n=1 Tax=Ceraceosorus bombacis TaxID=401625 RepID=A0A0P1BC30_9BASI|nr:DUSP, MKP [Ceraceosorus bombacis]